MKNFLALLFLFSFFACSTSPEEDSEENTDDQSELKDTIASDTTFEFLTGFPAPDILKPDGDYCLPFPNANYQIARMNDTLYSLTGGNYESVYVYLVNHIDSLGEKVITQTDSIFGPTRWYQKFDQGIRYEDEYYPEKGGGGRLYTKCKDIEEFRYLMSYILCMSDETNKWDADSMSYNPDGAGCYYDIIEEDNGELGLDWYCGC